jgi:hypothetical protein
MGFFLVKEAVLVLINAISSLLFFPSVYKAQLLSSFHKMQFLFPNLHYDKTENAAFRKEVVLLAYNDFTISLLED